jgi:SAM-dependent methyltransferase
MSSLPLAPPWQAPAAKAAAARLRCGVCGGTEFTARPVLWEALVREWQLAPEEARYIDRQQGECCNRCGANLRSIALANALRAYFQTDAVLAQIPHSAAGRAAAVLELNEAGSLSPLLRNFGRHVFGAYPEVDMHALPYAGGTFDLVIHSDTLEHVANPVHALAECRRVLRPGGALCFTVPLVVGRLSRSREGLPKSFHGNPAGPLSDDFAVQTEFGADAWAYLMRADFTDVTLHALDYPAAIAFLARVGWPRNTAAPA